MIDGNAPTSQVPTVALRDLDSLWFQVAGTRCNLACHHCFISCNPKNHSFGFLSLDQVTLWLEQSIKWGVRDYYFTGGEPFLNPDMVPILEATLQIGPATVLTNGTVLQPQWLQRLLQAEQQKGYSLEFRVSLDGFSPETNDPIRGDGTFARALRGIQTLVHHGFLPIITAARMWPEEDEEQVVGQFLETLRQAGYARPRLKLLPRLKLGAEVERTSGYVADERATQSLLDEIGSETLLCSNSRMITDRGVHVCPLLIEAPESLMGQSLEEAQKPFPLSHGACYTCLQYGAICSNSTVQRIEPAE